MNLATTFQDNVKPRLEKSIPWLLAGALAFSAATTSMNANAETQQVNHSSTQTQQAEPDDDVMDAANYAKKHNTVAIWICAPLDSGKTPEQLAEIAEKGFQRMGIPEASSGQKWWK